MASDGTFSSQAENASVAALLDRMRRGDRSAASEFVLAYGPLIRGRFRNRLSPRMRSYFDSLDLVSTVARRLDQIAPMIADRPLYKDIESATSLIATTTLVSAAARLAGPLL